MRPTPRGVGLIAAACAVLLLVSVPMIGPELALRVEASGAAPRGGDLSLIQFNAMKDNTDPRAAAAWIAAQRVDVVTIEEALQIDPVMRLLRREYPFQIGCLDHHRCSTAILSRRPPLRTIRLAGGDPDNRKGLSAVAAIVPTRGAPVLLVAAHLNRPWPFSDHDKSLDPLVARLRALPRIPTVLAGDFNMTPWTFAMARQDRAIAMPRLTRAIATWPAPGTFGTPLPILPIDHVYARGLHAVDIVRGPAIGSDHLPLRVRLEFDRPPRAPG